MYSQTSLIRASLIRMLYSPNTVPGSLISSSIIYYNDSVIRMFQNPNTLYNGCQAFRINEVWLYRAYYLSSKCMSCVELAAPCDTSGVRGLKTK